MTASLGKRKEASAKVQLIPGSGKVFINGQNLDIYIQKNLIYQSILYKPLKSLNLQKEYDIIIHTKGSGLKGQMEAIKLAISKALCTLNISYKKSLKLRGYLTRDSRTKERRKYGLKKARKAPQFSKR